MSPIYKRGDSWYVDYRVNGSRIRKKVGKSKKIAQLVLKDAEVKAAKNEHGFITNDIKIDKFIGQFLEYSKANHKPSTSKRYRAVMDHFRRFLSNNSNLVKLSQITPKTIDDYKIFRKNEWVNPNGYRIETEKDIKSHTNKGAKAKTINFEINVLRTAFNLAIKWEYLKNNPTKGVMRLKITDSKAPRFLSKAECGRLLDNSPECLYPIFFTFLNSGMRKAELENLEWIDVDFKRKKIKIRRKSFWQPKTGEREIPINNLLLELLKDLKKKNIRDSNFVFCDQNGNQLKIKLRDHLIRIANIAGIENLTKIHSLRHTFASHLVMKGIDLPTVQKLMGHADIQTTMIYAHLAPDHLADAVNKLNFN